MEYGVPTGGWIAIFFILYVTGMIFQTKISMVLWNKIREYDHLPLEQIIWNRAILFPIFFPISYRLSREEITDKITKYNFPQREMFGWPIFFLLPAVIGILQVPFVIVIPRIWDMASYNQNYKIRFIRSKQANELGKIKKFFCSTHGNMAKTIEILERLLGEYLLSNDARKTIVESIENYKCIKNFQLKFLAIKIAEYDEIFDEMVNDLLSGEKINAKSETTVALHELELRKEGILEQIKKIDAQIDTASEEMVKLKNKKEK